MKTKSIKPKMNRSHDCEQQLYAFADKVSDGERPKSKTIVLIHEDEGEEVLIIWCSTCGTLLEQGIEGVRFQRVPSMIEG